MDHYFSEIGKAILEVLKDKTSLTAIIVTTLGLIMTGFRKILFKWLVRIVSGIKKIFKKRKRKKTMADQSENSLKKLNILGLGNSDLYNHLKEIHTKLMNKQLYIGFPEEMLEELKDSYGKEDISNEFDLHSDTSFDGGNSFLDVADQTSIPELPALIEKHKRIVARHFIERENGCHFNKHKLGIFKINTQSRNGEDEEPVLNLELYHTDYFTHKVFRSIYKELSSSSHAISQVEDITDLRKYNVFTTSFGVNGVVILEDEDGDEQFIITKRARSATEVQSGDQYSISLLEGLTHTDRGNNGKIDLRKCVERGLCEELGIEDVNAYEASIKFYDVFLERTYFEIGITCTIEIHGLELEDLKHYAEFAKDKTLEVSELIACPNQKKELSNFIKEHDFKPQALYTLQRICAREGVKLS